MSVPVKFVVIVCGTTHPDGIEFNKMADAHARELVAFYASKVDDTSPVAPLGTPVRYLHFDVTLGVVHVAEQIVKRSKAATFKWKLLADFTSTEGTAAENPQKFVTLPANVRPLRFSKAGVTDPDFPTGRFKHVFRQKDADGKDRDVSGVMSITDVYRSIRGAPDKSVIDLVFFTHGFSGGPVIVNSFESDPLPSDFGGNSDTPQRDVSDKDGRLRTDLHKNMGEDPSEDSSSDAKKHGGKGALDQFKRAFDAGAVIRVYGCDVTDSINGELLRSTSFQVIRAAFVVKIASGAADKTLRKKLLADLGKGIGPEDDITLDMETEFALEANRDKDHTIDQLRALHIAVEKPGPVVFFAGYDKTTPFTKKWKDVLMFIASQNLATYHVQMAQTLGVKVLASPQGTSSENEQGATNNTMRVCRSFGEPGCFEFVKDPGTGVTKKVGHEAYAAFLDFYTKYFKLSSLKSDQISGTNRNFGIFDADALKNLASLRDTGKLP
jgi:hypothetical protein